MDRHGYRTCRPVSDVASMEAKPLLNLTSGYIARAAADLPKQGPGQPWLIRQNYILDMLTMKLRRLEDGILKFGRGSVVSRADMAEEVAASSVGD
jgi:hypothetical protein